VEKRQSAVCLKTWNPPERSYGRTLNGFFSGQNRDGFFTGKKRELLTDVPNTVPEGIPVTGYGFLTCRLPSVTENIHGEDPPDTPVRPPLRIPLVVCPLPGEIYVHVLLFRMGRNSFKKSRKVFDLPYGS
jgi:hypothetical protein